MTKMQTAGGIVGALGLAGLLAFGALSAQANHAPQPVPTVAAAVTPYVPHVEGPAFDPRPTAAAVTVVDAPVTVDPAPAPAPSVHGLKVPFIPSSDPQNAAGGGWDMSVCQGGSASTGADGTPYCD